MSPRSRRSNGSDAADALGRVAPVVTRWIERVLSAHDPPLTLAQYMALQGVADGLAEASEMARRAGVSPAAVSQLVRGLEVAGYVERARISDDRRRYGLTLTDDGRRILESAGALVRERLASLLAGVPKPELDALARLLRRLDEPLATAPPRRPHRPRPPRRR